MKTPKKYIVTGGTGFIGSHIVDALVNDGHKVLIIDNLGSTDGKKPEYLNKKATLYNFDISKYEDIEWLFEDVDGVFHTAALARIQPSFEDPWRYFEVNVEGTRNILKAAKKHGVRRIVYSASSSAYGDAELPVKEHYNVPARPATPYGATKQIGEVLMHFLGKLTDGVETVSLRYFNVYGPRQVINGPYPTVIGIFLDQKAKSQPLTIVPDGYQRRDFTWVGDVTWANVLAMHSSKVGNGEILNIGTGKNYSMWDVARIVLNEPERVTDKELLGSGKCVMIAPRKGEIRESLADNNLAKELLGWEPKVSLEEGIKKLL